MDGIAQLKLVADQSARGKYRSNGLRTMQDHSSSMIRWTVLASINNDPEYQLEVKRHPIPRAVVYQSMNWLKHWISYSRICMNGHVNSLQLSE